MPPFTSRNASRYSTTLHWAKVESSILPKYLSQLRIWAHNYWAMNTIDQSDDQSEAVTRLSEKQRECLALVLQHLTSKQIAKRLGISHHTVNQRLDSARRTLGVATRLDAAIVYSQHRSLCDSFVYDHPSGEKKILESAVYSKDLSDLIVREPFVVDAETANDITNGQPVDGGLLTLNEAAATTLLPPWERDAVIRPFKGSFFGANESAKRIFMILGLSVLMTIVIIVGASAAEVLTRLVGRF